MPHNPDNSRILIVVSPAQHDALGKLAEANGVAVADLIRQALLEKYPSIPDDLPARGKYKRNADDALREQLAEAEGVVEWTDLEYASYATIKDGLIQLAVEKQTHGGFSISVRGAVMFSRHGYTKLEGAKSAAIEFATQMIRGALSELVATPPADEGA